MTTDRPIAGQIQTLANGLACVLAPNPSMMTHWGTNTYLLGHDTLAVIDPGPDDPAHRAALINAIGGRPVSHVLVTHSHLDHSGGARKLADHVGTSVLAFGDSRAGRSGVMQALGDLGGGEGVDTAFAPDQTVTTGDMIEGDGWALDVMHTPGHFGNHLCFIWGDAAFTGDLVMGWASSLVSPPDGDISDFMTSCRTLAKRDLTCAYAGHGAPIPDAHARIAHLIAHRQSREKALLSALRSGPASAAALTRTLYHDTPMTLLAMAERNVLAQLIDLWSRTCVIPSGPISSRTVFRLK